MLAALLLAGIVAALVSSAALFMPVRRAGRAAGGWPATRRFVFAVLGTIVLVGLIAGALNHLGVPRANILVAVAVYAAVSLLWLPATRRWNGRGHLCWASSLFLFVAYLVFVLDWTLSSNLGPLGTACGLLLWVFEVAGLQVWRAQLRVARAH